MEVFGKGLAKRRDEGQRTAAEQDRRLDVPSMGQRHHRLDGHGMEDGGRDVFTADVPGHQILDIGLAEDSATRSNRIDTPGLQGQPVEFVDIGTQNDGHLVDERPCPSGAVAVHAQVGRFAVFEEDNLGILSSDVDHGRYLRIILLDSLRGGHHFLNERDGVTLGHTHAHRTGNARTGLHIALLLQQLAKHVCNNLTGSGMVSFIP